MISTTANKKKKRTIRLWAVAVWLLVWQAVSTWIGQGDTAGISCCCFQEADRACKGN